MRGLLRTNLQQASFELAANISFGLCRAVNDQKLPTTLTEALVVIQIRGAAFTSRHPPTPVSRWPLHICIEIGIAVAPERSSYLSNQMPILTI